MNELITRKQALEQAFRYYFTGKPCKRGHVALRFVRGSTCTQCDKERCETRYRENCDELKKRSNKHYHDNKETILAQRQKYKSANREKVLAKKREWSRLNTVQIATMSRRYRQENRQIILKKKKQYREQNPGKVAESRRRHAQANKDKLRQFYNERKRRRWATRPDYVMIERLRARLTNCLAGVSKSASTIKLLGCTREKLVAHIEAQFVLGMTWGNRSEWHIDHIKPCASFDMLDPEQQRVCFHYTNLQPLWALDNLKKGARLPVDCED